VRAEELEDSPRSPFVVHIGQEVWKLVLQKLVGICSRRQM
jgi:hypothetical protein